MSVRNQRAAERGQALPLVLVAVLLAVATMLAVGALAKRAVGDARARTAADAAALAGAAEGEAAARSIAADNGAQLVAYAEDGPRVRVEVSVRMGAGAGERRAVAAAERVSPPPGPPGGPSEGLTPEMSAAIARAEALLGQPVPIVSGWRSAAQQAWLWDHRATNPFPVARPGTSMHERGLAIDVPRWFVAALASVASAAGLCHPLPQADPVHFELC